MAGAYCLFCIELHPQTIKELNCLQLLSDGGTNGDQCAISKASLDDASFMQYM